MKKWLMSLILTLTSMVVFAAQPDATDAKALVEQQAKTIFTQLNANQKRFLDNPSAFSDLVRNEVLPYLDFELMSQIVLGRHWNQASASQKSDFTNAFRDLLVRVYSRGWTNYAGTPVEEAVKVLNATPVDKYQRTDIRIQVRDKNGKQAMVIFSLRFKGGQWKIYDVSFENVSILSSYRNSFDSEINQGGLDKLIAKIKTMKGNE
ncbi:MAG: ABC transporter substrate-binding protein [Cardiobacteriaceae bacterium]|nr:ABC transporter substrate-binding protein [Cardiobacteriaceae bacterium]